MPPSPDLTIRLAQGMITVPRCQARSKRSGLQQCGLPAVQGKRVCRVHGGKSTGPKTRMGKAAVVAAHLKHGRRAADYCALSREERERIRALEMLARASGLLKD
jgi:hypothetical protein